MSERNDKEKESKNFPGGKKQQPPKKNPFKTRVCSPGYTHDLYEKFDRESSKRLAVTSSQFVLPGRLSKQRVAVLSAQSDTTRDYFTVMLVRYD